ncbi:MAG: amino acid ABC transporter substrate-binding protein [Bdellovibrio sp.]
MKIMIFISLFLSWGLMAESTLKTVQSRGHLICGVSQGLPGFSAPDSKGQWSGLDVDICRAIAAAVLGDSEKVKYVSLSAQSRFTALQSGEIDILSRNSTYTLTRDSSLGLNFAPVVFYDGQGFMVRKSSKIKSAKQLNGATICTQQGTTTELNLSDYFRAKKMKFKPVVFESNDETVQTFMKGRCDAYTTDTSGLAAERTKAPKPDDYIILPEVISKEPLAPAVRHGDDQWLDIVTWVFYSLIEAEELEMTSKNIDQMKSDKDPRIKRFLGISEGNGKALGLKEDWAYNAVKQVGNYGEIFERNVGKSSPLKLERGQNALWTNGGLHYAPPLR